MKTIYLISCGSKKRAVSSPAGLMYTSSMFQQKIILARHNNADSIYILSALYGLLGLKDIIEPYDLHIKSLSAKLKKSWAQNVIQALSEKESLSNSHIVIYAGEQYYKYIIPHLYSYEIPLKNKRMGYQNQFFINSTKNIVQPSLFSD